MRFFTLDPNSLRAVMPNICLSPLIFLFLLLVHEASAQSLLIDEVIQSVEKNFPTVLSYQAELRKAEADSFSAKGGFDPVFKTSVSNTSLGYYSNNYTDFALEQPTPLWGAKVFTGWRSGQGNFPVYDTKYATFSGGELRGGVEVPLLKGGSIDERRAKIQSAESGVTSAQEGLLSQKLEARRQAVQKYWDWVAAGRKIAIAQELLDIALERDSAIRKRISHGDLPSIDQTDNQRSVFQRQSALVSAERAFQRASLELSLYLRDSHSNPWVVGVDRLPKIDHSASPNYSEFEKILKACEKTEVPVPSHPELSRLGAQTQQLETEYRLAVNQVLPKLDFQVGLYSDFGVNPGNNYLPPTGYPTELRLSAVLEFPILFRSARGKKASSQAALDKIDATRLLTLNKLQIQWKDSIQSMRAAYERLKLAKQEVELSRVLEASERTRAFQGDSSFLLVNLREQGTRDAMGKEVDAYSDFFKARADYDFSLGGNAP